jgi:hypothetical protein
VRRRASTEARRCAGGPLRKRAGAGGAWPRVPCLGFAHLGSDDACAVSGHGPHVKGGCETAAAVGPTGAELRLG